MTPEHVEGMWRRIGELRETDPAEADRTERNHYVSVMSREHDPALTGGQWCDCQHEDRRAVTAAVAELPVP